MPAIDYFRHILQSPERPRELAQTDRPVVGTMCNFVPEALVLAAGAVPVRVCGGDHVAAHEAESLVPRDSCPVGRSSVGLLQRRQGLHERLDLLVIPAVCDAKRKLPQVLDGQVPVHVMQMPTDKQAEGAEADWLVQVERLAAQLEDLTGGNLKRKALEDAIRTINARQQAFTEFLELRKCHPPRVSGLEMAYVTSASFADDVTRWTDHVGELASERQSASGIADGPRLLVTGAPIIHPDLQLLEIIEEAGAHVVADVMCSGSERLYMPIVPREWTFPEMLRAVAETALLPATCPCFTRGDDRVDRILDLVETYSVDGVVYRNLRLCTLFQFETPLVQAALERERVPMLELQMDYTLGDREQLLTRLQAFLEIVESRRPARR
jgi:benzoyl-CoA reductase/2-hydroxyglutaryl-CoA dehydratase subunit BcrC/BadD/HgdB